VIRLGGFSKQTSIACLPDFVIQAGGNIRFFNIQTSERMLVEYGGLQLAALVVIRVGEPLKTNLH